MDNIFTADNSFEFIAPYSVYYKGTDIMEYCWNRLKYCGNVDVNEILADTENIIIPENIPIGRFMEIVNALRGEKFGIPFMAHTPENCSGMTMDDIFGEENNDFNDEDSDDEDFDEDGSVTYDKCCCNTYEYCDEFHSHITLADLNSFFSTLNFKSKDSNDLPDYNPYVANDYLIGMLDSLDDTEPDDDIFGEDSYSSVFESFDEYDEVMDELLNNYAL